MAQEQDKLTPPPTPRPTAGSPRPIVGATPKPMATPSAPPPYPADTSSGRIKSDISETRSEMDDTVDALAARLQPRHLLDDALDYFTGKGKPSTPTPSGVGSEDDSTSSTELLKNAGGAVVDKLRQHPLPAVLIAAGVAWLFLEGGDDKVTKARARYRNWKDEPEMYSGSYVDARTGQPYDRATYGQEYRGGSAGGSTGSGGSGGAGVFAGAKGAASDAASRASDAAGSAADKASGLASGLADKASGAAGAVADTASDWATKARDMASGLTDSASSAASGAADSASSAAGYASRTSRQAYEASLRKTQKGYAYSRDRFDDALREYPVAVGVAGLAAGLLAGLLVPSTRREDELFGDYSDELKGEAADLGQHAWQETKHVAEATYDSAMAEAKKQGLTPEQLKQQAKQFADAAADQAEKHGLTADKLTESVKHAASEVKSAASDAKDAARESAEQSGTTGSGLAAKVKKVVETATDTAKKETQHAKDDLTADAKSKGESAKQTAQRAKEDAEAKVS